MTKFYNKYLLSKNGLKILDIGSLDINGNYKDIFKNHIYKGLDIIEGNNVDIVTKPYDYSEVKSNSIDAVISGQTFEHIKYPEKVIKEIKRILKPNGLLCIIAPSDGPYHTNHYEDFRRYTVDSMKKYFKDFKCIDCYQDRRRMWRDITFIGRKIKTEIKKDKIKRENNIL